VHDFVDFMCSADLRDHVCSLKKAPTKKKPLSFDRLGCAMLLLAKYLEDTSKSDADFNKAKETIQKWIGLVESNSNANLNMQFES
jgi:hypothetical protein